MTASPFGPAAEGRWREVEAGWELCFERRLRHPPERVWRALATPEGLACWLAEATLEPRPGGRMELDFRQPATDDFPDTPDCRRQANTVLAWDPPRLFRHSFGHPDSVVTWTLEPDGDGTWLRLVHRVPRAWECDLSRTLSGWGHHLEGLEDAVAGVRHPWDWGRWRALRDAYARMITTTET